LESEAIGNVGAKILSGLLLVKGKRNSAQIRRGEKPYNALNLKGNQIGAEGAVALAQALSSDSCPRIASLSLEFNRLGPDGTIGLLRTLIEGLARQAAARAAKRMEREAARGRGAHARPQVLTLNSFAIDKGDPAPALTALNLSSNGIGEAGARALAHALTPLSASQRKPVANENKSKVDFCPPPDNVGGMPELALRSVGAAFGSVGARGATWIAGALRHNVILQRLDLGWNGVRTEGASEIANALRNNAHSALTTLNLRGNCIGDSGVRAIARALTSSAGCPLASLNLDWNGVRDAGATALAKVITDSSTLQRLDLARNEICDAGADALAEALQHNKSVTTVTLHGNHASDASEHAAVTAVTANRQRRRGTSLKKFKRRAQMIGLLNKKVFSTTASTTRRAKLEDIEHKEKREKYSRLANKALKHDARVRGLRKDGGRQGGAPTAIGVLPRVSAVDTAALIVGTGGRRPRTMSESTEGLLHAATAGRSRSGGSKISDRERTAVDLWFKESEFFTGRRRRRIDELH
jgi:Ran GTPase-activating protein (RanGAP) involved in mRNA processing and transport